MDKVMYRMELTAAGEFIYDIEFASLEAVYSHIIDSFYSYCDTFTVLRLDEQTIINLFKGDLSSKEHAVELFNDVAAKIDGSYHKITKFYVQS